MFVLTCYTLKTRWSKGKQKLLRVIEDNWSTFLRRKSRENRFWFYLARVWVIGSTHYSCPTRLTNFSFSMIGINMIDNFKLCHWTKPLIFVETKKTSWIKLTRTDLYRATKKKPSKALFKNCFDVFNISLLSGP